MSRRKVEVDTHSVVDLFRDLRGDYAIGKTGRYLPAMRGVAAAGSGADYHYQNEQQFLRAIERAREFDRNNMIVGQGITRLIDNVMQDGVTLDVNTGDAELDKALQDRWTTWCDDRDACDVRREMSFKRLAKLSLRSVLVDGDALHLLLKDGRIETVEGHRVRTPRRTQRNVVHGVLLDAASDVPLEYWIIPESRANVTATIRVGDVRRMPVRDGDGQRQALHVYNPKRFSQTRGFTVFAPIVYPLHMHDDLQFAKLVQAQVSSCLGFIRETPLETLGGDVEQRGERTTQTMGDGSTRLVEGLSPGMEIFTRPGERITAFSPNVPNAEFFQHATLVLGIVAVNLNLPLAVLLLDPSNTNFSGWRGAIDQARIGFRSIQEWFIEQFHRPVYEWKVRQWLSEEVWLRQRAQGDGIRALGHRWNPPRWPYIEPLKDAEADALRLAKNLTSPRRLHAERGCEWAEMVREIVDDRKALIVSAIEAAAEINAAYPEAEIDWREIALFGAEMKASAATGAEEVEESEEEAKTPRKKRKAMVEAA